VKEKKMGTKEKLYPDEIHMEDGMIEDLMLLHSRDTDTIDRIELVLDSYDKYRNIESYPTPMARRVSEAWMGAPYCWN
jgi:hypothetical protein